LYKMCFLLYFLTF